MHYEEKTINGVLHCRYGSDEEWIPCPPKRITERLTAVTAERDGLLAFPSEEVNEAGNDIAASLIEASCCYSMNGLGGCKTFSEFITEYSGDNKDLIEKYLNNEIDSTAAIYVAMQRAAINAVKGGNYE